MLIVLTTNLSLIGPIHCVTFSPISAHLHYCPCTAGTSYFVSTPALVTVLAQWHTVWITFVYIIGSAINDLAFPHSCCDICFMIQMAKHGISCIK